MHFWYHQTKAVSRISLENSCFLFSSEHGCFLYFSSQCLVFRFPHQIFFRSIHPLFLFLSRLEPVFNFFSDNSCFFTHQKTSTVFYFSLANRIIFIYFRQPKQCQIWWYPNAKSSLRMKRFGRKHIIGIHHHINIKAIQLLENIWNI